MSPESPRARRAWIGWIAFTTVLGVVAITLRRPIAAWFQVSPALTATSAGAAHSADVDHYTCSMHPSVHAEEPGKCPICGMDLIAVTKRQQAEGIVLVDDARRQLSGVRTEPVTVGPMASSFSAAGRVAYDEASLSEVNLKVRGWITKLVVNETGQRVRRGQTLFSLYSPELYGAEQDFLLATRGAGSDATAKSARKRLELLGLSSAQIDTVAAKGEPLESIAVPSPASGFVIEKNVVEGAAVEAGMRLYRIATLDRVWVEADVYEQDLARVHVGAEARVTLDYLPDQAYAAHLTYVYPYLDPSSRTTRVRLEIANKRLELKPGMYAHVEITGDSGSRLQVPVSAVVYTGPRRLVFVDLGDGRFQPREVRTGLESDGKYEILSGLGEGDVIATSGLFLLAAEARIGTAAKFWDDTEPAPTTSTPPPRPSAPVRAAASPRPADPLAPSFTCPMHLDVHADQPGKCPKCGMDLVPAPEGGKP